MNRWMTVTILCVAVLVTTTSPAAASCLIDERPLAERLAEHPLVFVGTTTAVRDDGRAAEFEVHEVWRGDSDASVVVWGGAPGSEFATSVDRFFQPDTRYVVAARAEDGAWVSDSCMPTEEWDEARHAQARPASVSEPDASTTDATGASDDGGDLTVPLAIAAVLVIGAVGGLGLYRRRSVTRPEADDGTAR